MSYTFKTNDGQAYSLKITFGDVLRIREQTGVSLFDLITSEQLLPKIYLGDPAYFIDMLWAIISPRHPTLDRAQFYDALGSEALEAARAAFIGACADFFLGQAMATAYLETIPEILTSARVEMAAILRQASGSSAGTAG